MAIRQSGVDRHVFVVIDLCSYDCKYEASAEISSLGFGGGGLGGVRCKPPIGIFCFWLFLGALEINFWRQN